MHADPIINQFGALFMRGITPSDDYTDSRNVWMQCLHGYKIYAISAFLRCFNELMRTNEHAVYLSFTSMAPGVGSKVRVAPIVSGIEIEVLLAQVGVHD